MCKYIYIWCLFGEIKFQECSTREGSVIHANAINSVWITYYYQIHIFLIIPFIKLTKLKLKLKLKLNQNENETKRNETKRNETKRNETKGKIKTKYCFIYEATIAVEKEKKEHKYIWLTGNTF